MANFILQCQQKYSGEDGEYHHIEFRNDKGETFVESVPFVKAEDVANREGVNFRLDDDLSKLNINFATNETGNEILERISQAGYREEAEKNDRMDKELGQSERGRGSETPQGDAQEIKRTLSRLEENKIVEEYAKESNLWIPIEDTFKLGTSLGEGNENEVYLSKDKQSVYKVNNLFNSGGRISKLIEKINLHNLLFPETSYAITGITGIEGRSIYPIHLIEGINFRLAYYIYLSNYQHITYIYIIKKPP